MSPSHCITTTLCPTVWIWWLVSDASHCQCVTQVNNLLSRQCKLREPDTADNLHADDMQTASRFVAGHHACHLA